MLKSSLDFQPLLSHNIDLSVLPLSIIPPPLAVVSLGLSTLPISICLSSTSNVVELMIVLEPFTVKLPSIVRFPPTFKFSEIPTPPSTIRAPLVLLVELVVEFKFTVPVTSNVVSNVTASSTFKVPFIVVAEPEAPTSTGPPPNVVLPVEVANMLFADVVVPFVISPPFNIKSSVNVVTPVTPNVPPNVVLPFSTFNVPSLILTLLDISKSDTVSNISIDIPLALILILSIALLSDGVWSLVKNLNSSLSIPGAFCAVINVSWSTSITPPNEPQLS